MPKCPRPQLYKNITHAKVFQAKLGVSLMFDVTSKWTLHTTAASINKPKLCSSNEEVGSAMYVELAFI